MVTMDRCRFMVGVLILLCTVELCHSFTVSLSHSVGQSHGMTTSLCSKVVGVDSDIGPPSSLPDPDVLDNVLQVAIEASKKAADIIVGNAGGVEVMERKANSRDLLTLIDPMCEKVRDSRFCFSPMFDDDDDEGNVDKVLES